MHALIKKRNFPWNYSRYGFALNSNSSNYIDSSLYYKLRPSQLHLWGKETGIKKDFTSSYQKELQKARLKDKAKDVCANSRDLRLGILKMNPLPSYFLKLIESCYFDCNASISPEDQAECYNFYRDFQRDHILLCFWAACKTSLQYEFVNNVLFTDRFINSFFDKLNEYSQDAF